MKTDPNAPAFANATQNPNLIGMTKREYFAAFALEGLLAKDLSANNASSRAVQFADDLIKQLNQEKKASPERPVTLDSLPSSVTSKPEYHDTTN
jgi:hypothetical protein